MTNTRRVGVFVSNAYAYGQNVLEGVSTYCQIKRGWKLAITNGDQKAVFRHVAGHLDGVIAGIESAEFASDLQAWGKPCVSVFPGNVPRNGLQVYCDTHAIGKTGAEHLLDLGFKHFAFCCFQNSPNSKICQQAFEETIGQAGGHCHVHEVDTTTLDWPSIWKAVADWVAALPKPIGLMAAKDSLALEVLEACEDLGIHVPNQVAVMGTGNDILLCQRANPPLSSIDPGIARIGFQAAALLEEMMAGKSMAPCPRVFPPVGVVSRASTDTLFLNDPQMAAVLRYIREHACDPMQVNDLLSVVPLSRRVMEQRFIKVLGRSPHEEIRHTQLQRSTRLLAQSHLPLDQVARDSGFNGAAKMIRVFHQELGMTPGEYRRRYGQVTMASPA